MKTEIQKLIDFIESPKHAEDSEDRGYLSDGEVLDIVIDKIIICYRFNYHRNPRKKC